MQLPVGFVQDEPADSTEGDAQGVFDMIHQTSRSGHQDVDSFAEPEDGNQTVCPTARLNVRIGFTSSMVTCLSCDKCNYWKSLWTKTSAKCKCHDLQRRTLDCSMSPCFLQQEAGGEEGGEEREEREDEYLAFSAFLFSPPIRTPGTIQVNGYRERETPELLLTLPVPPSQ